MGLATQIRSWFNTGLSGRATGASASGYRSRDLKSRSQDRIFWPDFLVSFRLFRVVVKKRLLSSSGPSVHPYVSLRFPLTGFTWNLVLETSLESVERIQVWLKSDKHVEKLCEDLFRFCCCRRLKPNLALWTALRGFWWWGFYKKSAEKFPIFLKSSRIIGCLTRRAK